MKLDVDAAIVGSGPNGLAAAITLAQHGKRVVVYEAAAEPGGGCRSAQLTLPGFIHDVCAGVFPIAAASRFFRGLGNIGVTWIHPDIPLAHPFDDGSAVALYGSIDETAKGLLKDQEAYIRLLNPYLEAGSGFIDDLLAPIHIPKHPKLVAQFGLDAARSAEGLAGSHFSEARSRALFAGIAAHSMMALNRPFTAAAGLLLSLLGHVVGWPIPTGGGCSIVDGLVKKLQALGGEIRTETRVEHFSQLAIAKMVLFDAMPGAVARISGDALPSWYRRSLGRYRHGPGVFKIDWALSDPIPWNSEECRRAGTVHIGGTFGEIAEAESLVAAGNHPDRPFIILSQPTLFDPSRAPAGKHVGWAYCHVPSGSSGDMTNAIESQIERFAPGFRDCILARSMRTAADVERYNPNFVGGDIGGGLHDWRQLLTRPVPSLHPYRTPNRSIFICSAATPPGGGVHGLGGYYAALEALRVHK